MPVVEEVKSAILPKGKKSKMLFYFAGAGVLLALGVLAYRSVKGTPAPSGTPDATTAADATNGSTATQPTAADVAQTQANKGNVGTEPSISVNATQLQAFQKQVNDQNSINAGLIQLQMGQQAGGISTVPQQVPIMAAGGTKAAIPSTNQAQIANPADITTHIQTQAGQVGNKPLAPGGQLPTPPPVTKTVKDLQLKK